MSEQQLKADLKTLVGTIPEELQGEDTYNASNRLYDFIAQHASNDSLSRLRRFRTLLSTDDVKRDLELTHVDGCGAVVCDVEHDDTLSSLVSMAADHVCRESQEWKKR